MMLSRFNVEPPSLYIQPTRSEEAELLLRLSSGGMKHFYHVQNNSVCSCNHHQELAEILHQTT